METTNTMASIQNPAKDPAIEESAQPLDRLSDEGPANEEEPSESAKDQLMSLLDTIRDTLPRHEGSRIKAGLTANLFHANYMLRTLRGPEAIREIKMSPAAAKAWKLHMQGLRVYGWERRIYSILSYWRDAYKKKSKAIRFREKDATPDKPNVENPSVDEAPESKRQKTTQVKAMSSRSDHSRPVSIASGDSSAIEASTKEDDHTRHIKEIARERDNYACILTNVELAESTHIFPQKLRRNGMNAEAKRAGHYMEIFFEAKALRESWEKVEIQMNKETAANILTLSLDARVYWTAHLFALEPLDPEKHDDPEKLLRVRFHWRPKLEGAYLLVHCRLPNDKSPLREIKSGDVFEIETDNPNKRPLPDRDLLRLVYNFHGVVWADDGAFNDDSDTKDSASVGSVVSDEPVDFQQAPGGSESFIEKVGSWMDDVPLEGDEQVGLGCDS
ncbi:hypothetical protein BT63DRAFT_44856 [Microthyrium microscopicum]|uniref:HNH nuclease domain-containing protein n=1 Tax=Microthyrium microscopicum TaxID=703497 RepID=A0A6A6U4A0_9PEZI|nr:hypothetical protein BT63DRAFT_44856 [Microthyrium microscopicum]